MILGALESQVFQSTLPVRGATIIARTISAISNISIHAPREGSDMCNLQTGYPSWNFNPRSP